MKGQKVAQFISALDESRQGQRRIREDKTPVAAAPSHAPTSTAQWKTPSQGKSEDEGEHDGGEKDAIKKSNTSMPAPIAKAPSHAPTSGKDYTTSGKGGSEDQGEKISKEAIKDSMVNRLIDADDEEDILAIMAEAELSERGHKAGCGCGFCKNKGSFGKKKDEKKDDDDDEMDESVPMHNPLPVKRRIGGERMGFRHSSIARPRPKAASLPGGAMNPNQPAMEHRSGKSRLSIGEMADELLESPE